MQQRNQSQETVDQPGEAGLPTRGRQSLERTPNRLDATSHQLDVAGLLSQGRHVGQQLPAEQSAQSKMPAYTVHGDRSGRARAVEFTPFNGDQVISQHGQSTAHLRGYIEMLAGSQAGASKPASQQHMQEVHALLNAFSSQTAGSDHLPQGPEKALSGSLDTTLEQLANNPNKSVGQLADKIRAQVAAGKNTVTINGESYRAQVGQIGKGHDEYVHLFKQLPNGKEQIAFRAIYRAKPGGAQGAQSSDGGHYEQERSRHGHVSVVGTRFGQANPNHPLTQFNGGGDLPAGSRRSQPSDLPPAPPEARPGADVPPAAATASANGSPFQNFHPVESLQQPDAKYPQGLPAWNRQQQPVAPLAQILGNKLALDTPSSNPHTEQLRQSTTAALRDAIASGQGDNRQAIAEALTRNGASPQAVNALLGLAHNDQQSMSADNRKQQQGGRQTDLQPAAERQPGADAPATPAPQSAPAHESPLQFGLHIAKMALQKAAHNLVTSIHGIGECSKVPREVLTALGLREHNGEPLHGMPATQQAKTLAQMTTPDGRPLFQPVSQPRPGDYGSRSWAHRTVHGQNLGDSFIVTKVSPGGQVYGANGAVRHEFPVTTKGGYYHKAQYLRPTAAFYEMAQKHLGNQPGTEYSGSSAAPAVMRASHEQIQAPAAKAQGSLPRLERTPPPAAVGDNLHAPASQQDTHGGVRDASDWSRVRISQLHFKNGCAPMSMAEAAADFSTGHPPTEQQAAHWYQLSGVNSRVGYRKGLNGIASDLEHGSNGTIAAQAHFARGAQGAAELEATLSKGQGAIVNLNNPRTGNGHYVYAMGFVEGRDGSKHVLVADPGYVNNKEMSLQQLGREMRAGFVSVSNNGQTEASSVPGTGAYRLASGRQQTEPVAVQPRPEAAPAAAPQTDMPGPSRIAADYQNGNGAALLNDLYGSKAPPEAVAPQAVAPNQEGIHPGPPSQDQIVHTVNNVRMTHYGGPGNHFGVQDIPTYTKEQYDAGKAPWVSLATRQGEFKVGQLVYFYEHGNQPGQEVGRWGRVTDIGANWAFTQGQHHIDVASSHPANRTDTGMSYDIIAESNAQRLAAIKEAKQRGHIW